MSTYDRIAGLPVRVEGVRLTELTRPTSSGFQRISVEIEVHGGGCVGRGEDAWYDEEDIARFLVAPAPVVDLSGARTVDEASRVLGAADLVPGGADPLGALFRRWGFEAAVLDLALRQAGMPLWEALGRTPAPVDYVLSLRLGEPSSVAPLEARLAAYPDLAFKLDPTNDWDEALVARIRRIAPGRVRSLDFKGHYRGTLVDTRPDPRLYELCLAAWPDAWIEDPHDEPEIRALLAPHMDRVTWDAPIHSLSDITGLTHIPRMVNIKPCRFGSLRALMEVYDHCAARGIGMYGGGFFELGVGRGQIQYLASLFHPDAPNDVAPRGFHWPSPGPGIPPSPLAPAAHATGFAWDDADPPPAVPEAA